MPKGHPNIYQSAFGRGVPSGVSQTTQNAGNSARQFFKVTSASRLIGVKMWAPTGLRGNYWYVVQSHLPGGEGVPIGAGFIGRLTNADMLVGWNAGYLKHWSRLVVDQYYDIRFFGFFGAFTFQTGIIATSDFVSGSITIPKNGTNVPGLGVVTNAAFSTTASLNPTTSTSGNLFLIDPIIYPG